MLDCRCYGQHSHENESKTEIRREPLIRAVLVLDKTCSYKWYSSRLIFRRTNGPIMSLYARRHIRSCRNIDVYAKCQDGSTVYGSPMETT